ncbi:MAG: hypothetical protein JWN76_608 [Chitinophagaceae bacterium]|nr:hypothetical protein [Chitinophagaceae bacterium]
MQHYEHLIYEYLSREGEVSLHQVGVLEVHRDREPSVVFHYDKRAMNSDGLITYIAEKLGKNPSITRFDIESHLEQARQFIHIGKPYVIPGIGNIYLAKGGVYDLDVQNAQTRIVEEENSYQYNTGETADRARKQKGLMWLAAILVLALIAAGVYGIVNYFSTSKKEKQNLVENASPATDTLAVIKKPDSVAPQQNNVALSSLSPEDSAMFKVVMERTFKITRARSRSRYLVDSLHYNAGFDSVKTPENASLYRIYLLRKIKVADTAESKTNWRHFFGREISLEYVGKP